MVKNKIGVLVICYKQGNYIGQTLQSILSQNWNGDLEIRIFDDASQDNTAEVVMTLINSNTKKNVKIVYDENKTNIGYRDNFIKAFKHAQEFEFVAFCEGDDYWTYDNKLSDQIEILNNNANVGLVYTDVSWWIEESNTLRKNMLQQNNLRHVRSFEDHLVNANYFAPLTWLLRSKYLKDINWNWITTDGTYNIILYFLRKTTIYFYEKDTAVHRVLNRSIPHNTNLSENYRWRRGVFETQKKHAECWGVSNSTKELMYIKNYTLLLTKYAFFIKDYSMISEAKLYLEAHNAAHLYNSIKVEYFHKQETKRKLYKIYGYFKKCLAKMKL